MDEYKETESSGHNTYTNEHTAVMTAVVIPVQGQAIILPAWRREIDVKLHTCKEAIDSG